MQLDTFHICLVSDVDRIEGMRDRLTDEEERQKLLSNLLAKAATIDFRHGIDLEIIGLAISSIDGLLPEWLEIDCVQKVKVMVPFWGTNTYKNPPQPGDDLDLKQPFTESDVIGVNVLPKNHAILIRTKLRGPSVLPEIPRFSSALGPQRELKVIGWTGNWGCHQSNEDFRRKYPKDVERGSTKNKSVVFRNKSNSIDIIQNCAISIFLNTFLIIIKF